MRASFTIPGRFPSLNDYVDAERTHRLAAAAMKRRHTDRVCQRAQDCDVPSFHEPVFIDITWFEANRRRDPDNVMFAAKFILDGLVRAGVLENDTQRHVLGIEHRVLVDKARPRVQVTIYDPEGKTESD